MSFIQVIPMGVIRLGYFEWFPEHLLLTERFTRALLHVLRRSVWRPFWPVAATYVVENDALSAKGALTTNPFFDVVFITLEWLSCGADILVLNRGRRRQERSS